MKGKIKAVKLTKPKGEEASRYAAVLLEEVRDQFQVFGEGLGALRDQVDTFQKRTEERFDRIEFEIVSIKAELRAIKEMLDRKADRDYVEKLEKRLQRLETEVATLRRSR